MLMVTLPMGTVLSLFHPNNVKYVMVETFKKDGRICERARTWLNKGDGQEVDQVGQERKEERSQ